MKTVSLKEKADILIREYSINIISDILGSQPKKNKPFVFSDDSKNGNDYLFQHPEGFYGIKNFATDEFYNPIQAYQFKYNCDFTSAVNELGQRYLIYSDASLNHQSKQESAKIRNQEHETKLFSIKKKDFNDYDTAFWLKYGIPTTMLEEYSVSSLESYIFQSDGAEKRIRSTKENPIYAYRVTDDCYKIYQPLQPKFKFRWLGNKPEDFCGIFGIDQLPSHCRVILICEGLKDALAVNANRNLFGEDVWAVGKDSAQAEIHPEVVEFLKSRADEVVLCLDNDLAGKTATQKHSAKHQLRFIDLPKVYHCKDIAELLEAFLQQKQGITQSFFINLVNEAIKKDPCFPDLKKFNDLEMVLFRSNQIMKAVARKIEFSKPLLELNGQGVIFPFTINVIKGASGVHKSRLTETLGSAFLCKNPDTTFVNFKRNFVNYHDVFLLHFDTERNVKDQYPFAIQQLFKNAGLPKESQPNNFMPYSLVDISRDKRFELLHKLIKRTRNKTDKHIVAILDVVTDCNSSFNSEKDSLLLVDMMNMMINLEDITFICVIHQNPGSEKSRGHLGTEIENKSSTQIQIKQEDSIVGDFSDDIFRVSFKKGRTIKRPSSFHIYYDSHTNRLEIMDDPEVLQSLKKEKRIKAPVEEVKDALISVLRKPMNQQELISALQEIFTASKNTLKERIKEIEDGTIIDDYNELYEFRTYKQGSNSMYELVRCKDDDNQTNDPV